MDFNELKAKAEAFVGKAMSESDLKTLSDVATVLGVTLRVMGPNMMGTCDYKTDRLTVHKDDGGLVTSVLIG